LGCGMVRVETEGFGFRVWGLGVGFRV